MSPPSLRLHLYPHPPTSHFQGVYSNVHQHVYACLAYARCLVARFAIILFQRQTLFPPPSPSHPPPPLPLPPPRPPTEFHHGAFLPLQQRHYHPLPSHEQFQHKYQSQVRGGAPKSLRLSFLLTHAYGMHDTFEQRRNRVKPFPFFDLCLMSFHVPSTLFPFVCLPFLSLPPPNHPDTQAYQNYQQQQLQKQQQQQKQQLLQNYLHHH